MSDNSEDSLRNEDRLALQRLALGPVRGYQPKSDTVEPDSPPDGRGSASTAPEESKDDAVEDRQAGRDRH